MNSGVPTILLIDDDQAFSESLRIALARNDIPIEVAATWEEGLRLFRVALHELVVADYNLPGSQHGLKLLASIKPLRPSARLVLISGALTSRARDVIEQTSLVDRYIEKTSRLSEELIEESRAAIDRSNQSADWKRVGEAHMKSSGMVASDIEKVDRLLKGEMK